MPRTTVIFDAGRNAFARGEAKWKPSGGSNFRVMLVYSDWVPSASADSVLAHVTSGYRASDPELLLPANPTGAGDCPLDGFSASANLFSYGSGSPKFVDGLLLYVDSGSEATSTLVACVPIYQTNPSFEDDGFWEQATGTACEVTWASDIVLSL